MTLVHFALAPAEIEMSLVALGLSPRAPPIAPLRQRDRPGSWAHLMAAHQSPAPATTSSHTPMPIKAALISLNAQFAAGSPLLKKPPNHKTSIKNRRVQGASVNSVRVQRPMVALLSQHLPPQSSPAFGFE